MAQSETATKTHATGSYGIKSWDEKTWDGKDHKDPSLKGTARLSHAKVTFTFQGDFQGEGEVQFVMSYLDDANATFVGLMKMTGKLNGREGSFVVKSDGKFENGAASSKWIIIPDSGTGALKGIRGEGETVAHHGDTQPFTLDYTIG
jgi:hypothetical protein